MIFMDSFYFEKIKISMKIIFQSLNFTKTSEILSDELALLSLNLLTIFKIPER